MKRINLYGLLLFSTTLIINIGCSEESQSTVPPTYTAPPKDTTEPPNSAPTASAGGDIQVILPTDFFWLSGSYSDNALIDNFVWKKISGPSIYILESPNSLRTKVSKLEKGIYEFELTVTNKGGLTSKDTARVTVGEISLNPKEIIFKNMTWSCPWDCVIEIENIYSHLPLGNVFRVYIQRDNSADWREAILESQWADNFSYAYSLNGYLWIYYLGSHVEDTPNIKIVY
jgi:hypothetical protein